jgi:hypothetical protein
MAIEGKMNSSDQAWPSQAAGQSRASQAKRSKASNARRGKARRDEMSRGEARRDKARRGEVGLIQAARGKTIEARCFEARREGRQTTSRITFWTFMLHPRPKQLPEVRESTKQKLWDRFFDFLHEPGGKLVRTTCQNSDSISVTFNIRSSRT